MPHLPHFAILLITNRITRINNAESLKCLMLFVEDHPVMIKANHTALTINRVHPNLGQGSKTFDRHFCVYCSVFILLNFMFPLLELGYLIMVLVGSLMEQNTI